MGTWLSISITVILVVVAYLILNRNITARTSQQAALDEIKREVGAILTELNATSERNIELIEDRITRLESLIEQADRRITVLRRESEAKGAVTYSRPDRVQRPRLQGESSRADEPPSPETAPAPSSVTPDDAVGFQPRGSGPAEPEPAENLHARIRRLYLQGFPLERISSIVGKSLGEVELIISLTEGSDR